MASLDSDPDSVDPEITITRPSGRAVHVGYQRPRGMSGSWLQAFAIGSKMWIVLASGLGEWPPATNSRPSGRNAWPLQNWLPPPLGMLRVASAGSKTRDIPPDMSSVKAK